MPDKISENHKIPHLSILEKEAHTVTLELSITENLFYFQGHFENHPVIPGVVLIDWASQFGKQFFGIDGLFYAMKKIKFHHLIHPNNLLKLKLEYTKQQMTLRFDYSIDNDRQASGQLYFKPPETIS